MYKLFEQYLDDRKKTSNVKISINKNVFHLIKKLGICFKNDGNNLVSVVNADVFNKFLLHNNLETNNSNLLDGDTRNSVIKLGRWENLL